MITCGFVMFPNMTQLDLTGPYEVLARVPGVRVVLAGATMEGVRSEHGMTFLPETTFENAPVLDVLVVPGGMGVNETLVDGRYVGFVQRQSEAKWICSVCTGALLLGAAGLLRGYRATTHWRSLEFLPAFGAHAVSERVAVDRNLMTGGGVTAGIDLALRLAVILGGQDAAEEIQLMMEYDPAPPFARGHPRSARAEVMESLVKKLGPAMERRAKAVREAARGIGA